MALAATNGDEAKTSPFGDRALHFIEDQSFQLGEEIPKCSPSGAAHEEARPAGGSRDRTEGAANESVKWSKLDGGGDEKHAGTSAIIGGQRNAAHPPVRAN